MPEAHQLRQAGDQIEALLNELRSVSDSVVQEKAEELVQVLVEVYGSGLSRIVEILETDLAVGQDPMLRLADDEFVASLFILHGLHPLDTETRVQQALEKVRPYLGSHAGGCEFVGIDDAGVVHLRLEGSCKGCPSSTITVKMAIERAIEAAAPEITGIEVEGVAERPTERIISMDSLRRNGHAANSASDRGLWASPAGFDLETAGDVTATDVGGEPVVVLRAASNLYAYRNACPGCGSSWLDQGLSEHILTCSNCGIRFNVQLAGRGVDRNDLNLEALPLLVEHGVVQIAAPGAVA